MTNQQIHIIAAKYIASFVGENASVHDHSVVHANKCDEGWQLASENDTKTIEFAATADMDSWWMADKLRHAANNCGAFSNISRNGDDITIELYR